MLTGDLIIAFTETAGSELPSGVYNPFLTVELNGENLSNQLVCLSATNTFFALPQGIVATLSINCGKKIFNYCL